MAAPPTEPGPSVAFTLVEGIDVAWLERLAAHDPVLHAYALWDLQFDSPKTRFVTLREDGTSVAYLLVWYGNPNVPVVQWHNLDTPNPLLLGALPLRPLIAIVPEGVAEAVRVARAPVRSFRVDVMELERRPPEPSPGSPARRLTLADGPMLRAFVARNDEVAVSGYASIDLDREWVWGALEGKRLGAVARAGVRLPRVWLLTGIFTDATMRGKGFGRAVTELGAREAHAAGARVALAVRSDNDPARRLYEHLGFRTARTRVWIDAGSGRVP